MTLDCKLAQSSQLAQSLSSPAPFVEYAHAEETGQQSNVLSSTGSMDHLAEDARLSSVGGAERCDKAGAGEADLGLYVCRSLDGDDVSHSDATLHVRPPQHEHGCHAVWTPMHQKSAVMEPLAARGVSCSPCDREKGDPRDSSCLPNDSSDTATVYGLNLDSCACVARNCSGRSASPETRRQACS